MEFGTVKEAILWVIIIGSIAGWVLVEVVAAIMDKVRTGHWSKGGGSWHK